MEGRVKIIIEIELNDLWATEDQLSKMTDTEIIELCMEDVSALLDDATWKIER